MQTRFTFIFVALLLAASYFFGQWLTRKNSLDVEAIKLATGVCNPAASECYAEYNGHRLAIRFSDEPSALRPFTITVNNEFSGVNRITVDFVMQGMDMGINQLGLTQVSSQLWTAKGILPVCSLGRNDWLARFNVYQSTSLLQADIPFQSKIE